MGGKKIGYKLKLRHDTELVNLHQKVSRTDASKTAINLNCATDWVKARTVATGWGAWLKRNTLAQDKGRRRQYNT